MQRILVLNPKGGSGKTTIATNLASYFASLGDRPLLQDNDPQGSSSRWLKKRKPDQPFIHGVAAFERNSRMTRAWQMRIPPDAAHVIVDTPAAVLAQDMPEMTKTADAIIVPVLPSDIDIYACSRCIADTLLIPVIATLRDSQNYVRAAEQGVGLYEMKRNLVAQDIEDWEPLLAWLKAKEGIVRPNSGASPISGINPLPETA